MTKLNKIVIPYFDGTKADYKKTLEQLNAPLKKSRKTIMDILLDNEKENSRSDYNGGKDGN
ncbi:hypothetical protein [Paenibacillus alba]|uniref:Uncharacterized protein n=1 Tax=Paenibacillus alba TaxID=1197127 RepID=A0ABU6G7S7_9BACL|nr:hypothetical protein [Paenibacillus alba]MEC0229332.1 hypothetical protein [Paenibacillus alba]